MNMVFLNVMYAMIGCVLMGVMDIAMYKLFDLLTPFDTAKELDSSNQAVGTVVGGMILGINIGIGLVVGMSLN
jgi:uncharacterized membrane protein YjfL (UPF0719 family)